MPRHFPKNRDLFVARIVRAVFDRGLRGWTFVIHVGPGAGCGRWIFGRRFFLPIGWTFHIGRNVTSPRTGDRAWSIGLTRSGGATPYASH